MPCKPKILQESGRSGHKSSVVVLPAPKSACYEMSRVPRSLRSPGSTSAKSSRLPVPAAGPASSRAHAHEAERRAQKILSDPDLSRLLSTPRERPQIDRARQVFVNRNLRMSRIDVVGFDMDYTLAIYHMRRVEKLSFDMTVAKLVSEYNYPQEIAQVQYEHQFVMRGLAVDKA